MTKLFAKNEKSANIPVDSKVTAAPEQKPAMVNEEELDKAFNKPIVSEKLHLKAVPSKTSVDDAMGRVNKKSWAIRIVGVVVVLVIVSIVGLVATDNLYQVTGGLPEDPQKAIGIVMDKMQGVKSMHMEGSMTIDFNIASDVGQNSNTERIKYNISGDAELPDKNHFLISLVNSTMPDVSKADTEIITIGKKGYFRQKNSPAEEKNNEEWMDMDSASTGKAIAPSFDTSMVSAKYLKFIKEASLISKDGGVNHYKIVMDGEKILSSAEFDQLKKIYNDSISEFEVTEEIWVDSNNKLINKNTAEISMVTKGGTEENSGNVKIKNSIALAFSDFGKTVAIVAPDNVKENILTADGLGLSGNDEKRAIDLVLVANAIQKYNKDSNKYPSTEGQMQKMNGDNVLLKELVAKYLPSLPADPNPNAYYAYKSDGIYYELTAVLEDKNSSACKVEGSICIFKIRNGEIASKK